MAYSSSLHSSLKRRPHLYSHSDYSGGLETIGKQKGPEAIENKETNFAEDNRNIEIEYLALGSNNVQQSLEAVENSSEYYVGSGSWGGLAQEMRLERGVRRQKFC